MCGCLELDRALVHVCEYLGLGILHCAPCFEPPDELDAQDLRGSRDALDSSKESELTMKSALSDPAKKKHGGNKRVRFDGVSTLVESQPELASREVLSVSKDQPEPEEQPQLRPQLQQQPQPKTQPQPQPQRQPQPKPQPQPQSEPEPQTQEEQPVIKRRTSSDFGVEAMYFVALYDYTAQNTSELSFKADAVFEVYEARAGCWYQARNAASSEIGYIPSNYVRRYHIDEEPWYFGRIERAEAEELLYRDTHVSGVFLIRQRQNVARQWALSLKCRGLVQHYVIRATDVGQFWLQGEPERVFPLLRDLIISHSSEEEKGVLKVPLRAVCQKPARLAQRMNSQPSEQRHGSQKAKPASRQSSKAVNTGVSWGTSKSPYDFPDASTETEVMSLEVFM